VSKRAAKAPAAKATHVGVPAIFKLEMAARHIRDAYRHYDKDGHVGLYLVGSSIIRPDWRDVDVVLILDDKSFYAEFPHAHPSSFEWDNKWLLMTVALSDWLRAQTDLPVDFKIQPMEWANKRHSGRRHALGFRIAPPQPDEDEA